MSARVYAPPSFPLECAIVSGNVMDTTAARVLSPCNVALGKGVTTQGWPVQEGADAVLTRLLLPRGTDVRDRFSEGGADAVECPPFSGRWYTVQLVVDSGSGFPNEHRVAVLNKQGVWPTPLPPVWEPPEGGLAGHQGGYAQLREKLNALSSQRTSLDLRGG